MPELAEVEITRRKLLPLVRGRRILDFWTNWVRGLQWRVSWKRMAANMRGRKILGLTRHGKVLFFELSGRPKRMLAIHLRMSGRLEVTHSSASAKRERLRMRHPPPRPQSGWGISRQEQGAEKWVHFRWRLSGGKMLQFVDPRKFGVVWYGASEDFANDSYLGRLGRDARSLLFAEFFAILGNSRAMIKPFLLRQDKFAGMGNIIADESLWRAKIHPRASVAALIQSQRRQLFHEIQRTIQAMLSSGGTSLRNWEAPGGRPGRYQERRLIYAKAGEPCPRCNTKLARLIVGGRGTTICPRCQKAPRE